MPIRVRALARGRYDRIRQEGEEFEIAEDKHLGSWMEVLDPADKTRLAARIAEFKGGKYSRRRKAPMGVPATTAQLRDPPKHAAPVEPKPDPADGL